jgi:exodeoxyribonuclease VII small subunit
MSKKTTASPSSVSGEQPMTFEAAYRELEEIVAQLERGDLPLEQALELHARGQQLAALCAAQLEQAELKVRKLEIGDHRSQIGD